MSSLTYLSFSAALEEWAQQSQLIEFSLAKARDEAIAAYKSLRNSFFSEYGSLTYILDKFDQDRASKNANTCSLYVEESTKYNRITHEFLNSLILSKINCFLKDLNYSHRKCPYLIFYYYREEIIQSNGYINIDHVRHEIFFERNVFNAFLYAEKNNYRTITTTVNPLNALSHIPEYRLLNEGLTWPLEDIKKMHTEKHDPQKQQSKLYDKLKSMDSELCDEWARNLAILLNKRDQ